ncbi:MAG: alpha-2-macroglobulin [Cyanobacteria bacterium J06635_1]
MVGRRGLRHILKYLLLAVFCVLVVVGCDRSKLTPQKADAPPPEPLPEVAALPTPELPDWIESISPIDQAEPLAQIRIRFQSPIVPLESLESANDVLENFELVPELPGQFRLLTPRMVGFQADRALPKATRMQVTLKAGLGDLQDHQLEQDLAWTFNTEPIVLTHLPGTDGGRGSADNPIDLEPTLELDSNVELDLASLKDHVTLQSTDSAQRVAVRTVLAESEESFWGNDPSPQGQFDPSTQQWRYHLTPQRKLKKATQYDLSISSGLRPARGNLASNNSFDSQITTYSPLAFEGGELIGGADSGGAYGRFEKGLAQLRFNNGLVAESAIENITIEPPPKDSPQLVKAYDEDAFVNLNPWALEPETRYTITLGADLEDKFGQTLGEPVTHEYETGDLSPNLWAPSGLNIFPASQDLQLNVSTVNLPEGNYKAAFKVVKPTDLVYTDTAYPREKSTDLLPPPGQWSAISVTNEQNKVLETAIPLRERLGGKTGILAYGVKTRTTQYERDGQQRWREPDFYGLVQLTNLGVFAQWFPDAGLVRVHHLADGSAAAVPVEIYRSELESNQRGVPKPCAQGQTDPTGMWLLDATALKQCNPDPSSPPELLVMAKEGADWAFVRTWAYSGDYGYGIYADWEGNNPIPRGTIFSDRSLYKPGELAWFTGTAYFLQNGQLRQDKGSPYQVSVSDPDGNTIDLGTHTVNEFGTFSLKWQIPADQSLGYYSLLAKADGGKEISGEFRIAEFKPPNFRVDLSLDETFALVDDEITASAQSNYLFGPPVQGGQVEYYVTREPVDFEPEGWDDYRFGRQWYWPEERPTVSSDVLQESTTLSEAGSGEVFFTVEDNLPYPMTYRVDAEVVDVSNLSVADSKTFTALPSNKLIGLKSDFVADAETPFEVTVVVSDPEGKSIANQSIKLELQKITYSTVTKVVEGSRTPQNQIEYETVDETTVRSGKQPKTVELTPPEAGSYRVRANFANARADQTATDTRLWATGASRVYWGGRYTNNRLDIQLDKDRYAPGETATALIQSPYPDAELYFAVIRHDTLYKTVTKVKGGAPQVQFTVTPEMLPNAAVEAVLVRQGQPIETIEPGSLENLVSIGFAPFKTNLKAKYLTVEATPQRASLEPGQAQTLNLSLKDPKGDPLKGQVTVMVVNEAVLQLSGYRPPDLVETVYAEQPISTRFADNRPDVVLVPLASPLAKGWGYGGGFSAGAGSTRVRRDFKPLAYYNGSVVTDDQGQVEVTFKLPDDLTTWRVMAVATDGNLRFGNADSTFITTQPLISNPILPQFARLGDRIEAGLSVTNPKNQKGTLKIAGELSQGLQFASDAPDYERPTTQSREAKAESGTEGYVFPIVAAQPGTAQVMFTSQLGEAADAFQVPLEIKPLEMTEQVVETGTTLGEVTLPLNVDENVSNAAGGLEVYLASTLITEIKAPVDFIDWDNPLPCLESAASRLAIAASLQQLSQKYGQPLADFKPTERATQALTLIKTLQKPDGGFAAWPNAERSDPFASAYAVEAIAQAKAAGIQVDQGMVNALKSYLQKLLNDPGQYDYCDKARCKNQVRLRTLIALEALGDRRNQFLGDLHSQRRQFDDVDQLRLARYLSRFPDWKTEADELAGQYQETVYETGRTATINLPNRWRWFNSTTAAQAQVLRLFLARDGDPETLGRLVSGLLALRRDGTWLTTYDNAQALIALTDYAQRQGTPPDFNSMVTLAGKSLGSYSFQGYEPPSQEVSVAMADLPRGESDLTLEKSGPGTLHYLAAYRYRLQGTPPGRLNGLRVTREVRPANQDEILLSQGLSVGEEPLSLEAGEVFDIGLEIITDHPVDHVIITDPLPAGLEAIDTTFQTATQALKAQSDSWQIDYQTIYKDRILAYGDHLEAGVYTLHYLVRSVTSGTYLWPGADAHLQYAPEEFGRSAAATLQIVQE